MRCANAHTPQRTATGADPRRYFYRFPPLVPPYSPFTRFYRPRFVRLLPPFGAFNPFLAGFYPLLAFLNRRLFLPLLARL